MRFLAALLFLCVLAFTAAAKPNVILIFVDDQGYQDLGCFGSPNLRTPHIDSIAKEGAKFTDFYSASPVCSSSRASLMTGSYPGRVGITGVFFPRHAKGLHPDEHTMADMFKGQGYATAAVGKWHLGHKKEFLPTSNGFDSYYGIPYSNDMSIDPTMDLADDCVWREGQTAEMFKAPGKKKKNLVPLMRDTKVIEFPCDQNTVTKRFTEEGVKFINEHAGKKPFFLYLAQTMPHVPLYTTPQFEGKSEQGLYGDTIEEIDWSTGQLMQALKDTGVEKDTLIVYTTDNGPWHFKQNATDKVKGNMNRRTGGSALPLKGYKFSTWEGGMRVPCVMKWPGVIPPGSVCREVAATIDLLPTFAEAAGATLPADRKIDGLSVMGLLKDPTSKTPHDRYFYKNQAVRSGKWKLRGKELFDLEADISETTNVAAKHPEVVERLKKMLDEFNAEIKANARPVGQL
jgi:arylsulfatase A-like enzyme